MTIFINSIENDARFMVPEGPYLGIVLKGSMGFHVHYLHKKRQDLELEIWNIVNQS